MTLFAAVPLPQGWHVMAAQDSRDKNGLLDPREAGNFIRAILDERGIQVQQLAERTTVPDPDYLSNLLSGRINIAKSKHFPSIARELGLTADDVAYINPNLIIQVAAPDENQSRPLPEALQEASERYGDTHRALKNPSILQQLAAVRHWDGGPRTPEDWVDFYIDNRRRFKD